MYSLGELLAKEQRIRGLSYNHPSSRQEENTPKEFYVKSYLHNKWLVKIKRFHFGDLQVTFALCETSLRDHTPNTPGLSLPQQLLFISDTILSDNKRLFQLGFLKDLLLLVLSGALDLRRAQANAVCGSHVSRTALVWLVNAFPLGNQGPAFREDNYSCLSSSFMSPGDSLDTQTLGFFSTRLSTYCPFCEKRPS